jgi:hypothetical protein
MRYIVKTCEGREHYLDYLIQRIPGLEVSFDDVGGAYNNHLKALEMGGDDPVVHLEDDIVLTKGFVPKIEAAILEHPDVLIQFFSMRKADLTIGSRWEPGRTFLMAQCYYVPPKMGRGMLAYGKKFDLGEHKEPSDTMVAEYLRDTKQKYWLHVPSLVDHRVGVSAIDPRRSSKRQSFTFEDGDL